MGMLSRVGAGLAMLAAAATVPAEAGWSRGRYPDHHRRAEKVEVGDLLVGAALVGIVAAIASSKPKPEPAVYQGPSPDAPPSYEVPPDAGPADPAEAAAVDGCVRYVGQHYADDADEFGRVEEISSVEPTAKGFKVRGRLRIEDYRGNIRITKFRCSTNRSGNGRFLTIG